jgi:hypothetical protein
LHLEEDKPVAREDHQEPEEEATEGVNCSNNKFDYCELASCLHIITELRQETPHNDLTNDQDRKQYQSTNKKSL